MRYEETLRQLVGRKIIDVFAAGDDYGLVLDGGIHLFFLRDDEWNSPGAFHILDPDELDEEFMIAYHGTLWNLHEFIEELRFILPDKYRTEHFEFLLHINRQLEERYGYDKEKYDIEFPNGMLYGMVWGAWKKLLIQLKNTGE